MEKASEVEEISVSTKSLGAAQILEQSSEAGLVKESDYFADQDDQGLESFDDISLSERLVLARNNSKTRQYLKTNSSSEEKSPPHSPEPPHRPMAYWEKLARTDDVLNTYLDELRLWGLIEIYCPKWQNFSMPSPPDCYPELPSTEFYDNCPRMDPEKLPVEKQIKVKEAICRLLDKLPHRKTHKDSNIG